MAMQIDYFLFENDAKASKCNKMESFRKLGLSEAFIKQIKDARFEEPSEIQEKTIPLVIAGKDVIGGSATGSGKTLAFGAPIIERCEKGRGIQALILTPTRELAEQITQVLRHFSRYKHLEVGVVYGGVSYAPQIEAFEKSEILVATPGRMLDHLKQGNVTLKEIKVLVLDEADRMLDMGFINDVETIIKVCPKQRQTLLFSATITPDISIIAKKYLQNPVEISVESYVDASLMHQVFYDVPSDLKFSLLVHLLKNEKAGLVMVFCNTQRNTDFVARNLSHQKIDAIAIHGGLTQARRNKIMEIFHSEKICILVCTDVAARGLDIKGVSHVYNYDCPKTSKEYIHRIGRTARAGEEGIAISIISQRDYDNLRNVLRDPEIKIKQVDMPEIQKVGFRVFEESQERGGFGGRGGERRSFGGRSRFEGRRESGYRRTGYGNRGGHSERRESGFSGRSEGRREQESGERRGFGGRGGFIRQGSSGRFSRGRSDRGASGRGGSRGRSFGKRR
ncbi:MAG: DEAD/DEAH box helicase [Nanoarchaeota archaeon]